MQVIKKVLIILYTLFLGVIVFCNTSVFADDISYQTGVYEVSNGIDSAFINTQDYFDNWLMNCNKTEIQEMKNNLIDYFNVYGNTNYVVYTYYNSSSDRGYYVYCYSSNMNMLEVNTLFMRGSIDNFHNGWSNVPTDEKYIQFSAMRIQYFVGYKVSSSGSNVQRFYSNNDGQIIAVPLCIYNYGHPVFTSYFNNANGSTQVTNAIQQQTNTIKEESQKQQNAIATATQKQTNDLLDTNNTGNETMSVNDTTTDTSADLSSIYNNISSAFTSYDPTISWGKDFVFTLPNGDNFTINLDSSLILNFLDDYPVLKAFYQSIFWVIFGGYVIFDFKKIINKMKEGNIDNVVGTSSPVDSVVNMSLK